METRIAFVAVALVAWFFTQSLIAKRPCPAGAIDDRLHALLGPLNRFLHRHPRWTDATLIGSSALIDALGIFLLGSAVFGPSVRPLLALVIVFGLRQICQGLCALPAPEGMIWRRPPVPSLLVTYGVSSDLFFSGHTAIAVCGAIELCRLGGGFAALGIAIAVLEAATVLVLRAHYTMDVFAAVVAAVAASRAAERLAPVFDRLLAPGA
jgi:hypothetical protein